MGQIKQLRDTQSDDHSHVSNVLSYRRNVWVGLVMQMLFAFAISVFVMTYAASSFLGSKGKDCFPTSASLLEDGREQYGVGRGFCLVQFAKIVGVSAGAFVLSFWIGSTLFIGTLLVGVLLSDRSPS